MDSPKQCDRRLIEEARLTCAQIDETLGRLRQLESEINDLMGRLRWHLALGYDSNTAEFIKNLDFAGQRHSHH
ncbi:MAG TPA: hypothetical protein VFZ23_15090 [Pyrinomonadaceae bacterium]